MTKNGLKNLFNLHTRVNIVTVFTFFLLPLLVLLSICDNGHRTVINCCGLIHTTRLTHNLHHEVVLCNSCIASSHTFTLFTVKTWNVSNLVNISDLKTSHKYHSCLARPTHSTLDSSQQPATSNVLIGWCEEFLT